MPFVVYDGSACDTETVPQILKKDINTGKEMKRNVAKPAELIKRPMDVYHLRGPQGETYAFPKNEPVEIPAEYRKKEHPVLSKCKTLSSCFQVFDEMPVPVSLVEESAEAPKPARGRPRKPVEESAEA